MNIFDAIEALQASYSSTTAKAKDALDRLIASKKTGQLRDQLQEEFDRLQEDMAFFNPETSTLILDGSKRKEDVESELRKVASRMNKTELIQIVISQELEIWNLQQTLTFVTKRKKLDNKARLEGKTHDYENSQRRNTRRNEKFSENDAILMKVLKSLLNELGRDPIPSDYRTFKIRAEKTKPEFIPKPRESDEDKLLTEEDREHELGRKSRVTWSESTLRAFWERHTKIKASTKKLSSLKS